MIPQSIHVGYAASRRNGVTSWRAVAIVRDNGQAWWHCRRLGIGDSPQEAIREAIGYIRADYSRDGLEAPAAVIEHGRMSGALVDSAAYPVTIERAAA